MKQDSAAVDIHLSEMRRRNERWVAGFVAGVALLFLVTGTVQLANNNADAAAYSSVFVAASYAAYYGWIFVSRPALPPSTAGVVVRTLLEVSVSTWLTLLDARLGAEYALPRASVVLYTIAIFTTVLRLRPRLALLAGGAAMAEWWGIWWMLAPDVSNPEIVQASAFAALNRSLLLGACGFLAWRIASSQLELTGSVVRTALERERVRRAFGAYVAEPVVQRILSGDLQLGSERRSVAVLFCDIRSFTTFAEGKPPGEVLERLNAALEAFSICVQQEGGIVNKYLGDGLMAIFGAPVESPEHAVSATRAAVAIARAAEALAADGTYPGLRVGVGVHCGEVVVGDVGGTAQREYTAIGDVVNVASRVEGVTKELRVPVLVTDAVCDTLGDHFETRATEEIALRGRAGRMTLWEVVL